MASSSAVHAVENDEQDPTDSSSAGDKGPPCVPGLDISKPETKAVGTLSGIPDGGFVVWLQYAGSFFLFFNGFGMVNSFGISPEVLVSFLSAKSSKGVFQSYYEQNGLRAEPKEGSRAGNWGQWE
ncbi:hypothetical protein OEA41_005688 [Lepraria neglecta]|uniref:Uncharacterized protein n=1 Tax=Lepraria neglecta TaxID=209136 RepID=A0AAD9Z935_9LECA|nr:hypothetical protein OEA41_005688 [Lepraria neglecta]